MTRFIYPVVMLILVGVAVMQNFLWLAALFAVVFTFFYGAWPLFLLAVLIDGYFGAYMAIPYFSVTAVVWYVASELIRTRFRIMK
jgi:hypothetical protein